MEFLETDVLAADSISEATIHLKKILIDTLVGCNWSFEQGMSL
jgi:hypothetical protein